MRSIGVFAIDESVSPGSSKNFVLDDGVNPSESEFPNLGIPRAALDFKNMKFRIHHSYPLNYLNAAMPEGCCFSDRMEIR